MRQYNSITANRIKKKKKQKKKKHILVKKKNQFALQQVAMSPLLSRLARWISTAVTAEKKGEDQSV